MPKQCAVCISGHGPSIDAVYLAGGRSGASIAREFGLSPQTVRRHIRHGLTAPRKVVVPTAHPKKAHPQTAEETFRLAFGVEPLAWQKAYLAETRNLVLLKGRQIGATAAASGLVIHEAITHPGSLSAVISPSLRQSTEVATRARLGLWELGATLRQDSNALLRLDNGSRILSLPGTARGVRGYPCDVLILDESSWIEDSTWVAARATTAATKGRIVLQSTPGSPVGFFYDIAVDPPPAWASMVVKSSEVVTIDEEFLARERAEMDEAMYLAEYEAVFPAFDLGGSTFFDLERLQGMTSTDEVTTMERIKAQGAQAK